MIDRLDGRPLGKTSVYVDGANIFHLCPYRIDWMGVLRYLKERYGARIVEAVYYTGIRVGDEKRHGFLKLLSLHGWRVVKKEMLPIGEGGRYSANLDEVLKIELMIDAVEHPDVETIVLMSGDGGFTPFLDRLRRQGKRVIVMSWPDRIHTDLVNIVDLFVNLGDDHVRQAIEFTDLTSDPSAITATA